MGDVTVAIGQQIDELLNITVVGANMVLPPEVLVTYHNARPYEMFYSFNNIDVYKFIDGVVQYIIPVGGEIIISSADFVALREGRVIGALSFRQNLPIFQNQLRGWLLQAHLIDNLLYFNVAKR